MENGEAVEIMENDLYVAAMNGSVEFIQSRDQQLLLKKTWEKKNVIHLAIQYEQLEFIKALLLKFPNNHKLISDQEISNANTPLHIAAEVGNLSIMRLLIDYCMGVRLGEGGKTKPWMLKNTKGNTPVHVALVHSNVDIARFLLDKDLDLAFECNNFKEAPLHLAIKHAHNYVESESIMETVRKQIEEGREAFVNSVATEENKMTRLIEFLVKYASKVASWHDASGSTPLHRAASLCSPNNISITTMMIEHIPQCADVYDAKGKSILHHLVNKIPTYQEAKRLLKIKQICALRNHQDHLGDTPLHIAAEKNDINMVRVLLGLNSKLNINNCHGISALSVLGKRRMTLAELEAANKPNINFLKQRLDKLDNEFSMSQDSEGRNFLHILLEINNESHIIMDEFSNFISLVLERFPKLVCQIDGRGNTPIHILVQNEYNIKIFTNAQQACINELQQMNDNDRNDDVVELKSLWHSGILSKILQLCKTCIEQNQQEIEACHNKLPWLVQNEDGNTPLHEAVIAKNKELVLQLLQYDNK
ncbi:Ankyrin-2 [Bienertia sinuspersici]